MKIYAMRTIKTGPAWLADFAELAAWAELCAKDSLTDKKSKTSFKLLNVSTQSEI